jgi:hypothetical protein
MIAVTRVVFVFALLVLPVGAQVKPFSQRLALQGVTFFVKSPNSTSDNKVTISTRGLTRNALITKQIQGTVAGAELGDINVDGSPEIYVYVSAGKGRPGELIALSSNRKKSLTEIYLPELSPNSKEIMGYRGGDEFTLVENTFVRRFPIYRSQDTDDNPTGGMRQLQYKLKPGEAGWILKLDKVVEY